MLAIIIVWGILTSFCLPWIVFCGRRYEEAVPFSAFAVIALLYALGLLGLLRFAGIALLAAAAASLAVCIFRAVQKQAWRQSLSRIFTPGFFVFLFFVAVSAVFNYGRLATEWDEFSHWAYAVKAMTALQDFAANPLADAAYATYPPAVSLFQYAFQILNGSYAEWLLYAAYQTLAFSLFLPFFRRLNGRAPLIAVLAVLAAMLVPNLFEGSMYGSLMVDCLLGLLFGFALAVILRMRPERSLEIALVAGAAFVLTLLKSSGVLLSGAVCAVLAIDVLFLRRCARHGDRSGGKHGALRTALQVCAAPLAVIAAALSWKGVVARYQASDLFSGYRVLTGGGIGADGAQIVHSFLKKMFSADEGIGVFSISAFQLAIICSALLLLLFLLLRAESPIGNARNSGLLIVTGTWIPLYFIGLLAAYLFKFRPAEALDIPAFSRYSGTIFYGIAMFVSVSVLDVCMGRRAANGRLLALGLAMLLLFASPADKFTAWITRYSAVSSVSKRAQYDGAADSIRKAVSESGRGRGVRILAQEEYELTGWAFHYLLYPVPTQKSRCVADGNSGEQRARYEAWLQDNREFDFVYLATVDQYFLDAYGAAFTGSGDIAAGRLYAVDPETGILTVFPTR